MMNTKQRSGIIILIVVAVIVVIGIYRNHNKSVPIIPMVKEGKFMVPATLTKGTNLSTDSYVSVEIDPNSTACNAPKNFTENGVDYFVASTTDAAAGNRYEDTRYALTGTHPCVTVHYLIHYGVFENYPKGSIQEFDKQAVLAHFDAIRRSLVVNQ